MYIIWIVQCVLFSWWQLKRERERERERGGGSCHSGLGPSHISSNIHSFLRVTKYVFYVLDYLRHVEYFTGRKTCKCASGTTFISILPRKIRTF